MRPVRITPLSCCLKYNGSTKKNGFSVGTEPPTTSIVHVRKNDCLSHTKTFIIVLRITILTHMATVDISLKSTGRPFQ